MPITRVQLVGGSYTSRARSLDLSQTINAYIEPSADKKRGTLDRHARPAPLADAHRSPRARPLHRVRVAGSLPRLAARSTSCSRTRRPFPGGTSLRPPGL